MKVCVTIEMNAFENYFCVMLVVVLYKMVLALTKILKSDYLKTKSCPSSDSL